MFFNSVSFLLFFPAVFAVDLLLQRRNATARKTFLLLASWFFYAQWDPRFLILIWISTFVDWFVGNGLHRAQGRRARNTLLGVSLVVNLGLLGTFKYYDFFIESANLLLESLGLNGNLPVLRLILPGGISFDTFQTLSYTIEIWRGTLKPARSALDFALFVGFFPQLVAGPIVRASEFLPQVEKNPRASREDLSLGVYEILSGLFKKVVIADLIGGDLANGFYGDPERYGFLGAMAGIYGFAFQLFGDFAGYSQIAVGCGRILGFKLPQNFFNPYMARSNVEVWRRWHVTLITWMRDYIYIPLGGSRSGEARTYRNILITNLFSGVWHGAGINFVIWGLVNGLTICWSRWWMIVKAKRGVVERNDAWTVWKQRFLFFHVFLIPMPIFRTPDLATLGEVGRALVRWGPDDGVIDPGEIPRRGVFLLVLALAMTIASEYRGKSIRRVWGSLRPEVQGAFAVCLFGLYALVSAERVPFVYFQF
jgi:D-alanyl-lipoteichoic acid acyltransferase DltB (MBOAT superfamily)